LWVNNFLFIFVKQTKRMVDEDIVRLQKKLDLIPKVTKRYIRIKLKRKLKKITGIKLR
jgi:hypothetical protein